MDKEEHELCDSHSPNNRQASCVLTYFAFFKASSEVLAQIRHAIKQLIVLAGRSRSFLQRFICLHSFCRLSASFSIFTNACAVVIPSEARNYTCHGRSIVLSDVGSARSAPVLPSPPSPFSAAAVAASANSARHLGQLQAAGRKNSI